MKITNKTYFLLWRAFLLFLLLVIAADLIISQVPGSMRMLFEDHIPAIASASIIVILACIRVNYFSYEDEYEIIQIQSKSLLFGSVESAAQTRYEFPKRIIYDFDYKEGFFQKKLIIHLISEQGVKKVRKFNLTFVPLNKLKYVLQSLETISDTNKSLINPEKT